MAIDSFIPSSDAGRKRPTRPFGRLSALLFLAGTMLASGCIVHATPVRMPAAPTVIRGPAPGPGYIWVKGFHTWRNSRYVWKRGRWIAPHRGKRWVRGRYVWVRRGRVKVRRWIRGHWKTTRVIVRPGPITIMTRPLPVRPKVRVPVRPGPRYVWVKGYYSWKNGRYAWTRGRWVRRITGKRWIAGRYVWVRKGNIKFRRWVPGHWKRTGSTLVVRPPLTPTIVLRRLPARPRVVRPRRPGLRHAWIRGHHVWRGGRYVWVRGQWRRPITGKRWIPGHYRITRRGNFRIKVWVRGHWR